MDETLEHMAEFQQALSDYRPDTALAELFQRATGVFLVAPTAAGRNTIINELTSDGRYHFLISDTTRRPRLNDGQLEQDGQEYWFVDEAKMLAGLKRGDYLLPALIHGQQVSGISRAELEKGIAGGKRLIKDIDVQGYVAAGNLANGMSSLFVLPPSFDIWLQRLTSRGPISDEERGRRLNSAIQDIEQALQLGLKLIVNNQLKVTVDLINQFADSGTISSETELLAHSHAEKLLQELRQFLN